MLTKLIAAGFLYNDLLHKMVFPKHYIGVDWDAVKNNVLRSVKIDPSDKSERAANINTALKSCVRKARSLVHPKYAFEEKKIRSSGNDFIELEDGTRFMTARIPPYMKGAHSLVLFVVTIGGLLENEASSLTSGKDPLSGYLLDRIGSFAVESLAERLENRLRRDYSLKKNSVSSRFSP